MKKNLNSLEDVKIIENASISKGFTTYWWFLFKVEIIDAIFNNLKKINLSYQRDMWHPSVCGTK